MSKMTSYQYGWRAGSVRAAIYKSQGNGYADPALYREGFKAAQLTLFGEFKEEKVVPLTHGNGGPEIGTANVIIDQDFQATMTAHINQSVAHALSAQIEKAVGA